MGSMNTPAAGKSVANAVEAARAELMIHLRATIFRYDVWRYQVRLELDLSLANTYVRWVSKRNQKVSDGT